jgi:hypothetical protein
MKADPRIKEIQQVLLPLGKVQVFDNANEVSVVVDKPVDIDAVEAALLTTLYAEPVDRLERADSWRIRLMKRERERPKDIQYEAVRILDGYYEYRPQFPDRN